MAANLVLDTVKAHNEYVKAFKELEAKFEDFRSQAEKMEHAEMNVSLQSIQWYMRDMFSVIQDTQRVMDEAETAETAYLEDKWHQQNK